MLVVISKDKASAVADALLAPAEAERRRRLAQKVERQLAHFPGLAAVPEADRHAILTDANRYASRRWYYVIPAALLLTWILISEFGPQLFGWKPLGRLPHLFFLAGIVAPIVMRRFVVRAYVRRAVGAQRSGGADPASPPSA